MNNLPEDVNSALAISATIAAFIGSIAGFLVLTVMCIIWGSFFGAFISFIFMVFVPTFIVVWASKNWNW